MNISQIKGNVVFLETIDQRYHVVLKITESGGGPTGVVKPSTRGPLSGGEQGVSTILAYHPIPNSKISHFGWDSNIKVCDIDIGNVEMIEQRNEFGSHFARMTAAEKTNMVMAIGSIVIPKCPFRIRILPYKTIRVKTIKTGVSGTPVRG